MGLIVISVPAERSAGTTLLLLTGRHPDAVPAPASGVVRRRGGNMGDGKTKDKIVSAQIWRI